MEQWEPCIQISQKKKVKRRKEMGEDSECEDERIDKRERERERKKNSILFKIDRNWTIGFRRSKRQSRSTH